jgi:hypothetical protein
VIYTQGIEKKVVEMNLESEGMLLVAFDSVEGQKPAEVHQVYIHSFLAWHLAPEQRLTVLQVYLCDTHMFAHSGMISVES